MTRKADKPSLGRNDSLLIGGLPDGASLRHLGAAFDAAGARRDLFDGPSGADLAPLVYLHVFTVLPGRAKGWGVHREHDDRYALLRGAIEIALYDGRTTSATSGRVTRLTMSEAWQPLLTIPAGVWHAVRNIGSDEAMVVDMPTEPYHHDRPDKWTLPLDSPEIPVELGPGWNGF